MSHPKPQPKEERRAKPGHAATAAWPGLPATPPWIVLLLLVLMGAAGCEGPSFIAQTITGGDKIKSVYELQDRPTLIFVDDPDRRLGNTVLAGVASANAAHHLREHEVIKARIVPEKEVSALAARLGQAYYRTPIDEIGRELGAEQVIYALVERASLQAAPTFYRPTAILQVKVIDAEAGKRLYPPPPPVAEAGVPSRGRTLEVQLRPKNIPSESEGSDAMMARKLAERIGLELAQLFYAHKPDQPFDEQ